MVHVFLQHIHFTCLLPIMLFSLLVTSTFLCSNAHVKLFINKFSPIRFVFAAYIPHLLENASQHLSQKLSLHHQMLYSISTLLIQSLPFKTKSRTISAKRNFSVLNANLVLPK